MTDEMVHQEMRVRQKRSLQLRYQVLELDGYRYAVVRESELRALARRARVAVTAQVGSPPAAAEELADIGLDQATLAQRLILRRHRAGLTQAELARRAGIRVETLNRVERGKTEPDFATVRKLVVAMKEAEARQQERPLVGPAR